MVKALNGNLIAPCGVNCGVCFGYLRDKDKCPGCNSKKDSEKPRYCTTCILKTCTTRKGKYCSSCTKKYPCQRLKQLSKRYLLRYKVDLLGNLNKIKGCGIKELVKEEKIRWKCKECNGLICQHRGYCLECNKKKKAGVK
jgi:hypothetical protein